MLRPADEEFRPYQSVAPNRAALWPCCSAERFFGDASWGLTGDAGGGRGRSSPLAGSSRSRGAGAGLGSIAPTFPGPTAGADGCLGTAEVVCLGLGAKSSFSSAKPAFSRGYVCVIKSPEHCLFIAEIKTKLFLSFMALCVCVCMYILKMKIQPANKILQQEKSKPNFTAECVGSLEACWWPSLAVCCEPGIAGALFPLLHSFSCLSAGLLGSTGRLRSRGR